MLAFQIVSINVAEVYLTAERERVHSDHLACPTGDNLPVPSEVRRSPEALLATYPVAQGLGEARTHLARRFEELVGEVLRKEGEHEIGALGVGYEHPPEQEATAQELGIWQLLLPCLRR